MRHCALLVTALLASALVTSGATAGPLNPRYVPADSGWFVHLDVDAINASVVGRTFLAASEGTDFDTSLDQVRKELGLDPRVDIHGATIYGDSDDDEAVTVLLVTTAKADQALAEAMTEPTHRQLDVDGHVIHQWEGEDPTSIYVGAGPAPDQRIVVLSEKRDRVVDAVNVIKGRRSSLGQTTDAPGSRSAVTPRAGSLAFLYARGLPWLEKDQDMPASAIAQRSDRMVIDASEKDGMTRLDLMVAAKTTKDARDIADILRGLVGLGRMLAPDLPELADLTELLEAITIASDGHDIRGSISADSQTVGKGLATLAREADGE